jgi:hypothetical protein
MRRILMIGALGAVILAADPQIRRPVRHFIHFYRQQDSDIGILPRAVYSWLQAQRAD